MNLKEIHIGKCIQEQVEKMNVPTDRICRFLECTEKDIEKNYQNKSIDTYILLRWSKLLGYDFFRLYVGHLILYSPPIKSENIKNEKSQTLLFRKNIYTKEIKEFIIEKIRSGKMTPKEVTNTYNIPKSTLSKWLNKNI